MKFFSRFHFRLLLGTPRRFFLTMLRPGYVHASLARRVGECQRCGACCRLAWRCRYFFIENGLPSCRLYARFRFPNCTKFPINQRDLADRDLILPHKPCGYSWARAKQGKERSGK